VKRIPSNICLIILVGLLGACAGAGYGGGVVVGKAYADLLGTWSGTAYVNDEIHEPTLVLAEEKGALVGHLRGETDGRLPIKGISYEAGILLFIVEIDAGPEGTVRLDWRFTREGDVLNGSFNVDFNGVVVAGTATLRRQPPRR